MCRDDLQAGLGHSSVEVLTLMAHLQGAGLAWGAADVKDWVCGVEVVGKGDLVSA